MGGYIKSILSPLFNFAYAGRRHGTGIGENGARFGFWLEVYAAQRLKGLKGSGEFMTAK
jgi:hypothetical protein